MRGWLARGAEAAQLAGDRSDLWPAGSLAFLAYVGWLPLLVVLAQPDGNDLAFLGVSLYTSSAFPVNVIALGAAGLALIGVLCLVAAFAEVAVMRAAAPSRSQPAVGRMTLTAFAIILIATLPAALAAAGVFTGLISMAPAEYQSPETGTPVLVRLAGQLLPYLLLFVLALLIGQAFGGLAIRRAQASGGEPVATSLAVSARRILHRPWSWLGLAAAGMLADAITLLFMFAVLRVLWAPIGASLAGGHFAHPATLVLLLGFVTIWLALLLIAGALHVAVSALWAMELARDHRGGAD